MWWSPCWCPTSPLSSVHFSLFYPLLFKIYNFQCLHLHWFFFLSVQFFFWIPLVNFSIQLLYFSALGFLWLLFYLFADIFILFIFLNSFSCLSMYPSHSLSILKAVFLKKNLSSKFNAHVPSRMIARDLFYSFEMAMDPCLFVWLLILRWNCAFEKWPPPSAFEDWHGRPSEPWNQPRMKAWGLLTSFFSVCLWVWGCAIFIFYLPADFKFLVSQKCHHWFFLGP